MRESGPVASNFAIRSSADPPPRGDARCSDTSVVRRYVRETVPPAKVVTCQGCDMNPKFTHSVNEHQLSRGIVEPLLDHVKTDAFAHGDRPITYAAAKERFNVDTSVRRLGRVLDGVERILATRVWKAGGRLGRGV